ncbi:MAG: restriction endonuclease [Candidatus Tectomicrobia bacterium]
MDQKAIQEKLESLTEHDLQSEVVVPLLQSLGYTGVRDVGGPFERGRDLVCWRETLGTNVLYAVQIKKIRPSANVSSSKSFATLVLQLRQALLEPVPTFEGGMQRPSGVFIFTPYEISARVLESMFHAYEDL